MIVKRIIPIVLSVLIFAVSCTTISDRQTVEAALNVTSSLNNGDVDAIIGQSGTPFLFETEILPASIQLAALWEGLAESGYDFGPKGELTILDPDEDSWRRFSSSREVEVWFQRHAPEKAVLVLVPTDDGRLVIVIDRDTRSIGRIRGLKVEQE